MKQHTIQKSVSLPAGNDRALGLIPSSDNPRSPIDPRSSIPADAAPHKATPAPSAHRQPHPQPKRWPRGNPSRVERLSLRELALQDYLDDTRQELADAAEEGRPTSSWKRAVSVWLAGSHWLRPGWPAPIVAILPPLIVRSQHATLLDLRVRATLAALLRSILLGSRSESCSSPKPDTTPHTSQS